MPLVINSNAAATLAANNLAASSQLLQRTLNRLSSGSRIVNPSDDAGGLAVSMKLSATTKRQDAVLSNVSNSLSYLQTQDGALKVAGKILDRISELKTLAFDPTKSDSDLDNYNTEFAALQDQLAALGDETFNGVALFSASTLDVSTTESGGGVISIGGANLMGLPAVAWTNVGMNPSDWTASDPDIVNPSPASITKNIVNAGDPTVHFHNAGPATYSTAQNIAGPFTLSFDTHSSVPDNYTGMTISAGGNTLNLTALLPDSTDHHVEIVDDGVNASISINGGAATVVASLATAGGGSLVFSNSGMGGGDFHLANLSLTNTGGGGAYADVSNAGSLSALGLGTITGAIEDLATHRATNGAQQSRLGFASELLTTNKANLEAATSRISDVDVAVESTQLARYNVLVQAGTSMLAQANQSPQNILRLLN